MKFASAICLIGATSAAQAPVIKLDLDESALKSRGEGRKYLPARAASGAGYSESNYVHSCVAKKANAKSCPLPVAKAYDHHDGLLAVKSAVYLVNNDKAPTNKKVCNNKNCINYNLRSEWVVKYDASDGAGNKAEQVVFAIILNDPVAPVLVIPSGKTLESMKGGRHYRVAGGKANDNYDGAVAVKTSPATIDTYVLGKKTITYTTNDKAGMFGYQGKNNAASKTTVYTVVDTTKPVMAVANVAKTYECMTGKYVAPATKCKDTRDGALKVAVKGTVNTKKVGKYTVKYTCEDKSGNKATAFERGKWFGALWKRYKTVDTTKPVITLSNKNVVDGVIEHHAGQDDQAHKIANVNKYLTGYSCTDKCDGAIKPSASWSPAWNAKKVGTYVLSYGCVDASKNAVTQTRTVINVDKHKPVLNLIGASTMSVEASKVHTFMDPGATCIDKFEGDISAAKVAVAGAVDRTTIGTYTLTYNCKDTAGNAAPTQTRKVVIFDDYCPKCTVFGASKVTREASFPYTDEGAACSDVHDGKTAVVTVGKFDVEKVGTYKLTYRSKDKIGNWNDGAKCHCGGARPSKKFCPNNYIRTIYVKDTLKPVISLSYNAKVFHKSTGADKGINGQSNPAKDYAKFMAESQTSVNGWIIGAVASAVTGVALLGFAQKSTVTSVPV